MANKAEALASLAPAAEWVLTGDTIRWDSPDIDQPSDAEIDAEIVRSMRRRHMPATARQLIRPAAINLT